MMNNKNTWKTSKPSRRDKETLQEKIQKHAKNILNYCEEKIQVMATRVAEEK
jgi:hypothetical protein